MDEKDRGLFRSTWSLVEMHQKLLGSFLPLTNEIVAVLRQGRPSHEQLDAWKERYNEMNARLGELTVAFEALVQDAAPLIRYDA